MHQFDLKFKLIYRQYLLIAVSIVGSYTFLNWLFTVQLKSLTLEDFVVNFMIPIALPWVPLLVWLRPRLKLLLFKNKNIRNPIGGMIYLAGLSIIVPLILAQFYMITATGKLTRLNNIGEVIRYPETKYYKVRQFYVNKNFTHFKVVFSVRGKNNSDFDMAIYAAVPVFDHLFPDTNLITIMRSRLDVKGLIILNGKLSTMPTLKKLPADSIRMMKYVNPSILMPVYGDTGKFGGLAVITRGYKLKTKHETFKIQPAIWLAIKYDKVISNRLSLAEKNSIYKVFAKTSFINFQHANLSNFVYLNRPQYNDHSIKNYLAAIEAKNDVSNEPIILTPVFDSFDKHNGNMLWWTIGSFVIGAAIFLLVLNSTNLAPGVG